METPRVRGRKVPTANNPEYHHHAQVIINENTNRMRTAANGSQPLAFNTPSSSSIPSAAPAYPPQSQAQINQQMTQQIQYQQRQQQQAAYNQQQYRDLHHQQPQPIQSQSSNSSISQPLGASSRPPSSLPNATAKAQDQVVTAEAFQSELKRKADERAEEEKQLKKEGKRLHKCMHPGCGKLFSRREHLKRHGRSLHSEIRPHVCPYPKCTLNFSRFDNLRQHAKRHGNIAEWPQKARIAFVDASTAAVPQEARHVDQITLGKIKAPTPPPSAETEVQGEEDQDDLLTEDEDEGEEEGEEEEEGGQGSVGNGKGKTRSKATSKGKETTVKGKGKGRTKGKAKSEKKSTSPSTSSSSKPTKAKSARLVEASAKKQTKKKGEEAAKLLEIASRAPTWTAHLDNQISDVVNGNHLSSDLASEETDQENDDGSNRDSNNDPDEILEPYFPDSFFPSSPLAPPLPPSSTSTTTTTNLNESPIANGNGKNGNADDGRVGSSRSLRKRKSQN